jgi:IS30 family transposase
VVALTMVDREGISRGLAQGWSTRVIGRDIGRHHGVVAAEIARNGGRGAYRAVPAQDRAVTLRARPKVRKLVACSALHEEVNRGLSLKWSPRQISRRLKRDHPELEAMRVSHETIYECLARSAGQQVEDHGRRTDAVRLGTEQVEITARQQPPSAP